jgi:hypothetical protein
MSRYMNGLLASQVWWQNHTEVLRFFRDTFIAGNPDAFTHLEVGPGHGLFLHLAALSPKCRVATGWDISEASLVGTRAAVETLGDQREDRPGQRQSVLGAGNPVLVDYLFRGSRAPRAAAGRAAHTVRTARRRVAGSTSMRR